MAENNKQPLSFHATGVFTAPTMRIIDGIIRVEDWAEDNIIEKVKNIILEVDNFSNEKSLEIRTSDENLYYIEILYDEIKSKHPKTGVTIFREKLITSLLKNDFSQVLEIPQNRIDQNDSGGFDIEGKSFYSLAKEYIENVNR